VRASRLVSLLLLLQTRGGMTAAALASELEVSVRTIYRDVEALGAAGVPVYAEPGPAGGIRLVDGYRTRLTGLTEHEADALLLAGAPAAVAQLGLGTVLAAAELKVLAALPPELRSRASRVRERFHLDAPSWFRRQDEVPALAALAEAAWNDRQIRVRYRRRDRAVQRTLDPLGLVLKGGVWYLVARHRRSVRTYRVSRFESVEPLDGSFERPVGFDLASHWEASQDEFEESILHYDIDCRLSPVGVDRVRVVVERVPARLALASAQPDADGWVRVRLPAEGFGHATMTVMALAPEIEVLGPQELVDWVAATSAAMAVRHRQSPESDQRRAWAATGAMALTGRADHPPLVAPDGIVDRMCGLGRRLDVDVLPLLAERAALAGLARRGHVSCGGATRLLRAADGWLAVALTRDDDIALVPAWLDLADPIDGDPWPIVEAEVGTRRLRLLEEGAALLGLPVGGVPSAAGDGPSFEGLPVRALSLTGDPPRTARDPLVVDLSSLWAGPLCGRLLAERGARVLKVESTHRPDGARRGPAPFFALLNQRKEEVALDFRTEQGIDELRRLLLDADVVIEASRPRALEQLGIDAAEIVGGGPAVWLSITGHGREGTGRDRVAFGDDAAAAGGLVAWDDAGPCFVADAVADPLAGVTAAAAAVTALDAGGRWLIDVPMRSIAAHVAGPDAGGRWEPDRP